MKSERQLLEEAVALFLDEMQFKTPKHRRRQQRRREKIYEALARRGMEGHLAELRNKIVDATIACSTIRWQERAPDNLLYFPNRRSAQQNAPVPQVREKRQAAFDFLDIAG